MCVRYIELNITFLTFNETVSIDEDQDSNNPDRNEKLKMFLSVIKSLKKDAF